MKKHFAMAALALSVATTSLYANSMTWIMAKQEAKDPAVTTMINSLSSQFEAAAGYALPKNRKEHFRHSLTESLLNNVREGYCRNVTYRVHHDGHDLYAQQDVCKINDNLVPPPPMTNIKTPQLYLNHSH